MKKCDLPKNIKEIFQSNLPRNMKEMYQPHLVWKPGQAKFLRIKQGGPSPPEARKFKKRKKVLEKPEWLKGIFINGKYKQVQNRNAFSALATVMGGMSLEDAEEEGLLDPKPFEGANDPRAYGHPFRPKKVGKSVLEGSKLKK